MLLDLSKFERIYTLGAVGTVLYWNNNLREYKKEYGVGFAFDIAEALYVFSLYYPNLNVTREFTRMLKDIGFEPHPDLKKYVNLTPNAKEFFDALVEKLKL